MSITSTILKDHVCSNAIKIEVKNDHQGKDLDQLKVLLDQIYNGINDGVDDDQNGTGNEKEFGLSYFYQALPHGNLGADAIVVAAWLSIPNNQKLYDQFNRQFKIFSKVSDCKIPKSDKKTACDYIQQDNHPSPDFFYAIRDFRDQIQIIEKSGASSLSYYVYANARKNCPYFGMHEGMVSFTWPIQECQSEATMDHHHHHH